MHFNQYKYIFIIQNAAYIWLFVFYLLIESTVSNSLEKCDMIFVSDREKTQSKLEYFQENSEWKCYFFSVMSGRLLCKRLFSFMELCMRVLMCGVCVCMCIYINQRFSLRENKYTLAHTTTTRYNLRIYVYSMCLCVWVLDACGGR